MIQLAFNQTKAEKMVRIASTLLFNSLVRRGVKRVLLSDLTENIQYGYTASASLEEVGPPLVRITDIKDGKIVWDSVPFCNCDNPEPYLLKTGDILFARTGATTGKTLLVSDPRGAIFASYLIRLSPRRDIPPDFLYWFFQCEEYWTKISESKEGSAQPNVNGKKLLNLSIPLPEPSIINQANRFLEVFRARQDGSVQELPELPPPLSEQRRIVARIEEVAAKIAEARWLRDKAIEDTDKLLRSVLFFDNSSKPTPMRELVQLRQPDVIVHPEENYQFAGVYCFGRGVFKGQLRAGMDFAYPRLTRLRAGDFLYPKLMAWEGAFGVVPSECEGCVVSTEFPVFEIDQGRVFPEVIDTYFRMPSIWEEISGASTGTNVRRRRLNPNDFLAYRMPLPSQQTQERFREISLRTDELKRLQSETAVELDAMLPAILDRAFKGEL